MNGNGVWKWAAGVLAILLVSLGTYVAGAHVNDEVLHESVDDKHTRIDARIELYLGPIKLDLARIAKALEGV